MRKKPAERPGRPAGWPAGLSARRRRRWAALGAGLLSWPGAAFAEYGLNMTRGVTPISREVYELHMLIFWICVVIGVVVFGVMFWSIFHHRKSRGAVAAVHMTHSTRAEIVWTAIPILILVGMAIPATRTLIAMESVAESDLTIKVTGYQWKWRYDYLDEGFGFFSNLAQDSNEARQLDSGLNPYEVPNYLLEVDEPLVVPVNRKILFLTTANDVIHAWWVPELGWKRDAIPGFVNSSWAYIDTPGTYRGQCAELCGRDHAYMPVVLKAVPEEEYSAWVEERKALQVALQEEAGQTFSREDLMARGKAVYDTNCTACHQAGGQGIPGAFPALAGGGITVGPIGEHMKIVLYGKPGTAMQAFGAQLGDADLAALVTYERNAWGNDALLAEGAIDMVQPADVATYRNGGE